MFYLPVRHCILRQTVRIQKHKRSYPEMTYVAARCCVQLVISFGRKHRFYKKTNMTCAVTFYLHHTSSYWIISVLLTYSLWTTLIKQAKLVTNQHSQHFHYHFLWLPTRPSNAGDVTVKQTAFWQLSGQTSFSLLSVSLVTIFSYLLNLQQNKWCLTKRATVNVWLSINVLAKSKHYCFFIMITVLL